MLNRAIVMAVLLIVMPSVCWAQTSVPVIAESAKSPIVVSRMLTAQNFNDHYLWVSCLNFTNTSTRGIRAVQFKFTYYDAFDTEINTFRADRVGEFAPGVLIEGPEDVSIVGGGNISQKAQNCWVIGQLVGSLEKVTAEVMKIRYDDGEIWSTPQNHPIFTANYMGGGANFVPPPKEIKCGIVKLKYWWFEQQHNNAKATACVMAWERDNGNLEGWPPNFVPKSPDATRSPSPVSTP